MEEVFAMIGCNDPPCLDNQRNLILLLILQFHIVRWTKITNVNKNCGCYIIIRIDHIKGKPNVWCNFSELVIP